MKLSIQKAAFILLFIVLSAVIMIEAGVIIKPLAFALLATSIFLKPVRWLEKKGIGRIWSALIAMITGSLIIAVFGFFLTSETIEVMTTLKSELNVEEPSQAIANEINKKLPGNTMNFTKDEVAATFRKMLSDVGMPLISNTFKSTSYFVSNGLLALVYTFLILLYRQGIVRTVTQVGSSAFSEKSASLLHKMLKTGQQYLSGLGIVIVILAVLYGLIFKAFGLDYPLVFAAVAACLAVIPYIGTTLGASLPVIYAFLSYDNHYIALGLIASILAVQLLEGNLLTPKVVGGNMELNPLASLIAVVAGNFIWGLAGMVLFLPLAAMMRIAFAHSHGLKPLAELAGKELTKQE
ncbi:MAG: AI-2E family transporter [Roseivirga sp.]